MGGGIGGLLDLKQSGQNYSYLYDGKGNVTAILDGSQAVVATYTYDAFGNLMSQTGSLSQPFKFSTKIYDPETGLSYFGYRFYSPALGRWITEDPIGYEGGLNLYGYVGNDPVDWADPFGLKAGSGAGKKKCTGMARVLQGNPAKIGKPGGFSGNRKIYVTENSAVIAPEQWGGKAKLRPYLDQISGTIGAGEACFNGVTDVIGGDPEKRPDGTWENPRQKLMRMYRYQGKPMLLLELPGGEKDFDTINVTITIPDALDCPQGTVEVKTDKGAKTN